MLTYALKQGNQTVLQLILLSNFKSHLFKFMERVSQKRKSEEIFQKQL